MLEAAGVDLVLSGHSHAYERSFLLDGLYDSSTPAAANIIDKGDGDESGDGAYTKPGGISAHKGAVYVVAGSSGKTSGGSLDHPVMISSLNELGSLVIDVDDNRMDVRFLRETGAIDDGFTVLKGDYTPPGSGGASGGAAGAAGAAGTATGGSSAGGSGGGGNGGQGGSPGQGGSQANGEDSGDSGGCGCRLVGAPVGGQPIAWLSLGLALLWVRRTPRRRRAFSSRS